jgi:hypothetical protein
MFTDFEFHEKVTHKEMLLKFVPIAMHQNCIRRTSALQPYHYSTAWLLCPMLHRQTRPHIILVTKSRGLYRNAYNWLHQCRSTQQP